MDSPSLAVMEAAEILWDYHQLHHPTSFTDVAIGLGSHDIGVAEHAAELYHKGLFPLIVFSGANAPTTLDVFPRGEAIHYAERAGELGVPPEAIAIEPYATNTAENITFSQKLLNERGLAPGSATIISRPYQQRRAYATARKLWPRLEVVTSSRKQPLDEYVATIGDPSKVLNMLVGDTQRIWAYSDAGFAIYQAVDKRTLAAFHLLLAAGYDRRILPNSSTSPQ